MFWLVGQQSVNHNKLSPHLQTKYLPLGEILQQAGLLSSGNIRQALKIQKQYQDYRFGEILIEQGYLPSETINFFVNDLPELMQSNHRLRLGDYFNNAGLLLPEQISEALKQQYLTQRKFGEIITQRGWVNPGTLNWFVNLQNA
ncbi:MAG: hypothetical protein ACFCAD_24370 [Pleurocapsa sp.]